MPLRVARILVLAASALLVAGLAAVLRDPGIPLGVPGEWTWARLGPTVEPVAVDVALGAAGVALYIGFAAAGLRDLARPGRGKAREAAWVASLVVAGAFAQFSAMSAAPPGFGPAKAVTLSMKGSSGYYHVARSEMEDPAAFLRSYPEWIREQDVYHIGTHPPGLFVTTRAALGLMDGAPGLARGIDDGMPVGLSDAFRQIVGPMPRPDRAALVLIAAMTWLACASTSAPLYLLMRGSGFGPSASWSSAALWPLVPSAILFQPTADAAFPLLAASAVALATSRRPIAAALSGLVLAVGMAFTLAFLAVGLIVGLMQATAPGLPVRRRAVLILATGAGFLAPTLLGWLATGANPFLIWWANQRNHAGFYVENPRSFARWLAVNPVELAVALGLAAACWGGVGLASRRAPRASWITLLVLLLLTLTGRSLSEVARLWLPFAPMLVAAAGPGQSRLGGGVATFVVVLSLLAAQVLAMQLTIQVVYPDV
jgi:hypothetical protein